MKAFQYFLSLSFWRQCENKLFFLNPFIFVKYCLFDFIHPKDSWEQCKVLYSLVLAYSCYFKCLSSCFILCLCVRDNSTLSRIMFQLLSEWTKCLNYCFYYSTELFQWKLQMCLDLNWVELKVKHLCCPETYWIYRIAGHVGMNYFNNSFLLKKKTT